MRRRGSVARAREWCHAPFAPPGRRFLTPDGKNSRVRRTPTSSCSRSWPPPPTTRLARRPARARARGRRRRAARAAAARRALRAAPPRRSPTTDDLAHAGGRRRADGGARQARQLPRREPLHHLGLQVRAARGGREGAAARVARARDRDRRGALAGDRPTAGCPRTSASSRRSCCARSSDAVRTELTPHQREVFCALALNGVPIDVLAERLGSTRGALYKTLHDARRKLREVTHDR